MYNIIQDVKQGKRKQIELIRNERAKRLLCLKFDRFINFRPVHNCGINSLDLDSKENRFMLSGGHDGIIALHDTGKKQAKESRIAYNCLFTINEFNNKDKHSCGVYDVKWLPQETNAFLSWSCDRYIKIWDTRCVQVNSEFHFSRPVYKIALPKLAIRSSLLAVGRGAPNYSVELIDLRCGEINCKFNGHSQLVSSLSWSKTNENIIASGSDDCKISIWDIRNGKDCLLSAKSDETEEDYNSRAHSGPITALEFTDDGLYLISLGEDNKLRLWCALTGNLVYEKEIFKVSLGMSITEECNPDLIFIPSGNTVDIINLRDGKYLNTLQNGQSGRINCTCLNNSTLELYSGGVDGNIHCWNDEKTATKILFNIRQNLSFGKILTFWFHYFNVFKKTFVL